MKNLVPVDASGRLVLPKAIRRQLDLENGGVCQVEVVGGAVELRPMTNNGRRLKKVGRFLVAEASGKPYNAVDAINAMREERL